MLHTGTVDGEGSDDVGGGAGAPRPEPSQVGPSSVDLRTVNTVAGVTAPLARRLWLAAVVVLTASLLVGVAPPAGAVPDVSGAPEVVEAQSRLREAEAQLTALMTALDEAAEAYETANAHSLRLEAELAGSDAQLADARKEIGAAAARLDDRVRDAYMRPATDMALAELGLSEATWGAPDAATALHRTALLRLVAAGEADQLLEVERAGAMTADAIRQHRIVEAGAAAAAADRQRRAEELSAAVEAARAQVADAQLTYGRVEADAVQRAEDAELAARAAAQARAAARARARERGWFSFSSAASGAPPEVSVDGKVCPVGRPYGFIDSWGFPRSGGRTHKGVDIFAAHGTPLYAVADGYVSRVGTSSLGGLSVHVIDTAGNRYYYAHLSSTSASAGQPVRAGDVVGAVGNTGNARTTPPHLHWQFHPGGGSPVNPYPLAAALCRTRSAGAVAPAPAAPSDGRRRAPDTRSEPPSEPPPVPVLPVAPDGEDAADIEASAPPPPEQAPPAEDAGPSEAAPPPASEGSDAGAARALRRLTERALRGFGP